MKLIERQLFLLLALLAFAFSALCYVLLERSSPGATDEQYVAAVQQRVKAEMAVSTAELETVSQQIWKQGIGSFGRLQLPTRYPYFIYRRGVGAPATRPQLVFWSDYQFVPDFATIASVNFPKLIDFRQGRYLVSRKTIRRGGDTLDVFSLVNVYRSYTNTNTYLRPSYNAALFALDPQELRTTKALTYQNIYDNTPVFLFSVVPPVIDSFRNRSTPVNTVILAALGMLFLGLYVIRVIYGFRAGRRYELGFLTLAGYLLLLRVTMLYFGVPFLFFENDLFNPKYYASSVLAPSLGDLLLNCLAVVVMAFYLVNHYFRTRTYAWITRQGAVQRAALSLGSVMASFGVFYACFVELNNIYEKSQFTLDITLSIHFDGLKVASLLIFIAISFIYFLTIHLLAGVFTRINPSVWWGLGWLLAGAGLSGLLLWVLGLPPEPVLALNLIYFGIVYLGRLPKVLYTFRYQTSIYLFLAAFTCALLTAYVVYFQEIRKDLVHKREFAGQMLAENDELGEFLLNKAQTAIGTDPDIRRAFTADTLLLRERIQQRVKSVHLDKYFDKYDVEVSSFRANGQPLDDGPAANSYASLRRRYEQAQYRTDYPGIYFRNEPGNHFIKQYIGFAPVQHQPLNALDTASGPAGFVVLDLKLRVESPKSVYPELLVDNKFIQAPETRSFSYAIFNRQNRLAFSTGSYNYERKMPLSLWHDPAVFAEGLSISGYKHVGLRGNNDRTIVVSSPDYPAKNIYSNFSFLYLLLVMTVIIVILLYALRYGLVRVSLNYATRVQILLNIAFFLPLVLVVLITLGVISANYVGSQETAYVGNTRNIAANFLPYLDEWQQGKRSVASMEEELKKIARDADMDINLFDTRGRLITATQPLMYEGGLLSKFINPTAYGHLIEDKENQLLLDESLGSKQYRTAYAGIKSFDGRLLGILSIPYFDASNELDRQLIDVVASALSVFTGLFMLFLVVSYLASNVLTRPLRLLTQKIRRTNLDQLNEPLKWKSDDEIGLLIGEYNRMLLKLEDSKRALSHSEKQSAWREMAKQVAHEIKNPLTPMKLTLQHLQRTLPANGNGQNKLIHRTFETLLDQIDNLSDIATSFSDFAKMPLPKNELFEITSVLTKAADLYADDQRISFQRDIQPGPVRVVGDRQLFGRIITNLIINAIQSVPPDRKATLALKLTTSSDEVNLEIHDNGAGIPEGIRAKVFLPNFSTKQGGSGLGLAIAKRGIEHAGGNIWFETEEGVGTSFFITLPLANSAGAQPVESAGGVASMN